MMVPRNTLDPYPPFILYLILIYTFTYVFIYMFIYLFISVVIVVSIRCLRLSDDAGTRWTTVPHTYTFD